MDQHRIAGIAGISGTSLGEQDPPARAKNNGRKVWPLTNLLIWHGHLYLGDPAIIAVPLLARENIWHSRGELYLTNVKALIFDVFAKVTISVGQQSTNGVEIHRNGNCVKDLKAF